MLYIECQGYRQGQLRAGGVTCRGHGFAAFGIERIKLFIAELAGIGGGLLFCGFDPGREAIQADGVDFHLAPEQRYQLYADLQRARPQVGLLRREY